MEDDLQSAGLSRERVALFVGPRCLLRPDPPPLFRVTNTPPLKLRGRDRTESEVLSEPLRCYHEGMPACRATARLHTLSESDAGLASPSGDQAGQRHSEQS